MAKQVIVHWDPSPSDDVERQELILRKLPHGVPQTYRLGPTERSWSTKNSGPLDEGQVISVTIRTIDKQGLQDSDPPSATFKVPAEAPKSASNITFEVRDYDAGPTGPGGPTGPTA